MSSQLANITLESITLGVLSNLIFTLTAIYGLQRIRYCFFLRRKFHNKVFYSFRKRFPNEIVNRIECKVHSNIFKFSGIGIIENNDKPFKGEIIVNPFNLKTGEGYSFHDNSDAYAFIKVIIKDNETLLIDAPYIKNIEKDKKKVGMIEYQAFIWRVEKN